MKKLLSVLLAVLMLASISVCAFAAPSPTQNKDNVAVNVVEAEKAEANAVKTIKGVEADDDVTAAAGKLPANATNEMKADYANLEKSLVSAKDALSKNEEAAIPADVKAEADGDAKVVAGQPFRCVASEYPATITLKLDNPEDFVGMMVFVNGKWVKLNAVVNDDGTVTFVLDQPAVLSIASQVVAAA